MKVSNTAGLEGTAGVGTGAPVPSTAIIYVIDRSGSTAGPAGGCVAAPDTVLHCEQQAALNLNSDAASTGTVGRVAVVSFESVATTNLGPTPPSSPTVATAINGLVSGGGTSFGAGLNQAVSVIPALPGSITNTIIVFMSDGLNNVGPNISTVSVPTGVIIKAFAVGAASDCTSDPSSLGSLADVAAKGAAGSDCTHVTDLSTLPSVVPAVIASKLISLILSVDGGPDEDISSSASSSLPATGPTSVTFSKDVTPLAPGVHTLCVTANGTDGGGAGSVNDCVTVTMVTIDVTPDTATNELGTPGQTHTVTATVAAGAAGGIANQTVNFLITSGPNAGKSGSSATNSSGQATFTYTAAQGLAGLGTDHIRGTIGPDSQNDTASDTATKIWRDTTPPRVACLESVNPNGKNIPPAGITPPGSKGGQNPDGFYQMTASDAVDPNPRIWVGTSSDPLLFGPFLSGVVLKITEAPGATPSMSQIGGPNSAVTAHLKLNGDAVATAVDASGNSATASCLVPPPPK